MADTEIINALSIDLEDWFHMVEIDAVADPSEWDGLESIVARETEWILRTLEDAGVRATFFVLGWIAEKHPDVVRAVAEAGHEIGSHGFWHRRVDELDVESFREDLERCHAALRDAGVDRIPGFRAPTFSIRPGSEWAFDVLHDLGFRYDASLFPASRAHGGYPCPRAPHVATLAPSGRPMPELPMSVMDLAGRSLAFSGGGYFRLFPRNLIARGFAQNHAAGRPVVTYLHPRDFAVDTPRVPMPIARRFKCYVGLRSARDKFRWMLDRWRFDTCEAVLAAADLGGERAA